MAEGIVAQQKSAMTALVALYAADVLTRNKKFDSLDMLNITVCCESNPN